MPLFWSTTDGKITQGNSGIIITALWEIDGPHLLSFCFVKYALSRKKSREKYEISDRKTFPLTSI